VLIEEKGATLRGFLQLFNAFVEERAE